MTGWWEYTQYRAGLVASGVATVAMAAMLALTAAVNPAEGPSWRVVVFVPLVLLLAMVAGMILIQRPWRYAADIAAMRAGRAWVHWTYNPGAWRAANSYDQQRNALRIPIVLTALGFGGFLLLVGILGGQRTLGLSTTGGGIAVIAAILLPILTLGDPVWLARRAAKGEIYISRHGIYRRPGGYMSLDPRRNLVYESADLVERPTPHIHIAVLVPAGGGSAMWERKTLTDVGVPPGHEDEARTLVERLRREVVDVSRHSVPVCTVCSARGESPQRASARSRGDDCDHDGRHLH
jgi:hypothetical protein